jgi:hypothetical protein
MIRILALLVFLTAIVALTGCSNSSSSASIPAGMKATPTLTSQQLAADEASAVARKAQRRANQ